MFKDLHWRLLLLGGVFSAVSAAATPYVTLKLGMGVDLSMAAMFVGSALLAKHARDHKQLAVELNILQSMVVTVSGIGFMVVIMAAFYYIQDVFHHDIHFHPTTWQLCLFLAVSALLGVFMGILPRRSVLKDKSLPWPTAKATLVLAQTLTDPAGTEATAKRRTLLYVTTAVTGFLTFLRDGLGVIQPIVGNGKLMMAFGPEFIATGIGMLVSLSVGLSGLLGVWFINSFGETVAKLSALTGTAPQHWETCSKQIDMVTSLEGADKQSVVEFLTNNCGKAMDFVNSPSHFKFVVQWMMWPATAMMIAAALTSITIPMVRKWKKMDPLEDEVDQVANKADEYIPTSWIVAGIAVGIVLTAVMVNQWFQMSFVQALLAVAIQPVLIVSGLRVLGVTGQGPVSLMANATQFLFGLIWPAHIAGNLNAAYVGANPQAAAETVVPSFWVAQRLGGKFKTLVVAQLIVIPIGAILTPIMFNVMQRTYGIGLEPGQLSAPTGLKIASLALVMEKGLTALPRGALTASIVAVVIGVLFEILLALRRRNADGSIKKNVNGAPVQVFPWVPIPAAFGFALILPPSLTIGTALGAVVATAWKKLSSVESLEAYGVPFACGLMAGEILVGSILVPLLAVIVSLL